MNIRNPGQDGADKDSAPENTGAGKAAPVHMYRVSLLILFFMMGSVFGSWASRIPDIKRALSLSDGALGLALFAAPTGEFAAVAVAALLIKRWGSQAVILAGLPCYAVCLTGLGLAPSLPFLAAALFLFGFASNTFNIALNAQAVDVECLYKRPIMSTFHGMWSLGGVAGGTAVETNVVSKYEGRLEIDELRTVKGKNAAGESIDIVISRQSEFRIVDPKTEIVLYTHNLPYGSTLFMEDGAEVKKGDLICEWDPYNAVIISEYEGRAVYDSVIEGVTYRDERDEQTGLSEKVVIESKDKTKNPVIKIVDKEGLEVKQYNLPVGAHVVVKDNAKIKAGDILIKIPRAVGKSGGDITGGLPRVTELFEARNPSNPAIVSEIDGEVSFGKIKRGNREIVITSKQGDVKRYLVPLSRQIIVQENDYVKAGSPLSDGAITPSDILNILGPTKVQEYIVNEVQEVYRMQGVKINDKHFEVIVRQMMNKVKIEDPGDTRFFEDQVVDKWEFMDVNDELYDKVVVTDAGDSTLLQPGQIVSLRKLRDENSSLKRRDQRPVQVRDIVPATSTQVLQGITRAALQTSSFISAASFQETTKVLNEAAIQAKVDPLENLKENVICGHLIPGGTGLRDYDDLVVGSKADFESLQQAQ